MLGAGHKSNRGIRKLTLDFQNVPQCIERDRQQDDERRSDKIIYAPYQIDVCYFVPSVILPIDEWLTNLKPSSGFVYTPCSVSSSNTEHLYAVQVIGE